MFANRSHEKTVTQKRKYGFKPMTDKIRQRFLKLLNDARAKRGLRPVKLNTKLNLASDRHSKYQTRSENGGHYGPRGPFWWFTGRAKKAGYKGRAIDECTAAGQSNNPLEVLKDWRQSRGHWKALMDPRITEIGIGYNPGGRGRWGWGGGRGRWTFMSGRA